MATPRKQPHQQRRRQAPVPELDWRELASGPALRGLSEALATPTAPESTTEGVTPSVSVTPTVVESPAPRVALPPRARRVTIAEESMTLGEERFYHSVWNAPASAGVVAEDARSKVFSLGYDRLAKLVRLDEKSVRSLIPKLAAKKILDILAAEDSPTRTGRTYRVFSPDAVVERQRAVGLEYVVKNGRAVEFVPPTAPVTPTVGDTPTEAVLVALRQYGTAKDSDAQMMVAAVRRVAPGATVAQIVRAIHERGRAARAGKIANPLGYLMVYVPRGFS